MSKNLGFTLIEMLIGAAIGVSIFVLINETVFSGSRAIVQIGSQSDLSEDIRNSGMLIADGLKGAAYIYPPGVSITLTPLNAYTSKNLNGSTAWTVGTDPFIAFIQAPTKLDPTLACNTTDSSSCMQFVAYYPIQRSEVITATTNAGVEASIPPADPAGTNSWMLYEYRQVLNFKELSNANLPQTNYSGGDGRMVADHILPNNSSINGVVKNGFTVSLDTCQTIGASSVSNTACVSNATLDPKTSVVIGSFTLGGRSFQNSDSSLMDEIKFPIVPLNLAQK